MPEVQVMESYSWICEIRFGPDDRWARGPLRFATVAEALDFGTRHPRAVSRRAAPSSDPVNARITADGRVIRVGSGPRQVFWP